MSASVPVSHHCAPLTLEQAEKLRSILRARGFQFFEKPHTLFAAKGEKINIAVYKKGPKVLLQGKDIAPFIEFVLEPEVLGEATFGYEEELHPDRFSPHFGIDETGKGDFFGPLVIAGVYVDSELARKFREQGIIDSKRVTTDGRIRALAQFIRKTHAPHTIISISPSRYNDLIDKLGNVNRLLAWGHARAIENLLEQVPDCPRVLSDKFAQENLLRRALLEKGRSITLEQQTKAESDPAVAAASILAREKLIDWFEVAAKEVGEPTPFPRGASANVKQRARALLEKIGTSEMRRFVKTHFKTFAEICGSSIGEQKQPTLG